MAVRITCVLALGVLAGCGLDYSNRGAFQALTYDRDPPRPPDATAVARRDHMLVFATLQHAGLVAFQNPAEASACYRALTPSALQQIGDALAAPRDLNGSPAEDWAERITEAGGALSHMPNVCTDDTSGENERTRRVMAVAHVAGALHELVRTRTHDATAAQRIYNAAPAVLDEIAQHFDRHVAERGQINDAYDRPALALSGGSANGAYTAGFLFELFSVRERALAQVPQANRDAVDSSARFGAVVGTSVGALLAQLVDLYFAEAAPRDASQDRYLACCLGTRDQAECVNDQASPGSFWPNTRPSPTCPSIPQYPGLSNSEAPLNDLPARREQACALTMFYRFTQVNEGDLLCVEPGTALPAVGALGRRRGLVRFDPMIESFLGPAFDHFSRPMAENDVDRVVVSVEIEQNTTIGLDERACDRRGDLGYCLSSGVMASVVLPFFSSPVAHTYPWPGGRGRCGSWLDGGLRSGFPLARALRFNAISPNRRRFPRIPPLRALSLSTDRLHGNSDPEPGTVIDIAMQAIGEMGNQNHVFEVALAQHDATRQLARFRALHDRLNPPPPRQPPPSGAATPAPTPPPPPPPPDTCFTPAGPVTNRAVPEFQPNGLIQATFVPEDVPAELVAGAGYAFDPHVMTGLFTWGRLEAIRQLRHEPGRADASLFRRLGWCELALASETLAVNDLNDPLFQRWRQWFSPGSEPASCRNARMAAGRTRLGDPNVVPSCDAPSGFMRCTIPGPDGVDR